MRWCVLVCAAASPFLSPEGAATMRANVDKESLSPRQLADRLQVGNREEGGESPSRASVLWHTPRKPPPAPFTLLGFLGFN